jgi:hypothetical protein
VSTRPACRCLLHVADPIACLLLTHDLNRPSIDETHRNFAYRAQPSMTSLNQSTSNTRGDDLDRDQFNPTPSQTNLHRVYTNESHHSREPLTTPHMDSQAAFQPSAVSLQSQQAPTIRPIKEADYGNPNHASPQLRQGGGFAYPPGQYQSIPLNDHAAGEKPGKRGIAWGGGERYSRNGTKEGEFSRTGIMVVRLVFGKSLIRLTSWHFDRARPLCQREQPKLRLLPRVPPSIPFSSIISVPRCVRSHGRYRRYGNLYPS